MNAAGRCPALIREECRVAKIRVLRVVAETRVYGESRARGSLSGSLGWRHLGGGQGTGWASPLYHPHVSRRHCAPGGGECCYRGSDLTEKGLLILERLQTDVSSDGGVDVIEHWILRSKRKLIVIANDRRPIGRLARHSNGKTTGPVRCAARCRRRRGVGSI